MRIRFLAFSALLIVAVFVFLQTRASSYRVERSLSIAAAPREVYRHIDDLHEWQRWSPWDELDPKLKRTFSGPERGKGASYAWEGNEQVGKGRIAVIAAKPPESVRYSVQFEQPLQTEMTYDFTITPEGDGSKVSWVFQGEHPFWAKVFALFLDLDKQLGADMDKGLADLKVLLEVDKS
jgi:uncharacterized protein YndB with AHSA1/START domain